MGHMGGLINPRPGRGQYRAGFSNTGGSPKPRKTAPCQKVCYCNFKTVQVEMHSAIIRELVEQDDIKEKLKTEDNWRGNQAPLHMSAALGNLDMVKMLLKAGANVNAYVCINLLLI